MLIFTLLSRPSEIKTSQTLNAASCWWGVLQMCTINSEISWTSLQCNFEDLHESKASWKVIQCIHYSTWNTEPSVFQTETIRIVRESYCLWVSYNWKLGLKNTGSALKILKLGLKQFNRMTNLLLFRLNVCKPSFTLAYF